MIEQETNPQQDYTSPGDEWTAIEEAQARFMNLVRRHAQGDKALSAQEVLREAQKWLDQAREQLTPRLVDVSPRELMQGYWPHIAARKNCATTGLKRLDDALGGGLESERLVVLLGAPGAGKTALAHQIADHIANAGRPVLYVTSEDTPFALLAKTLARIGEINYTAVLKGWETERAKINAAIAMQRERASSDMLRYIDATQGLTLEAMKALALAHFSRYPETGQGVLVVDYLQRFARAQRDLLATGRELREVVTVLTERLRAIASELNCCVVALASQNRASGYGSGSALASAKESGDIEYTADVIMALVEDGARKPGASFLKPRLLRIDKNRQGAATEDRPIQLDWQGDRQRFTEAAL